MIGRPAKPMIERFLCKVRKGTACDCHIWAGAKDKDGYGFIKRKDGKQIRAHRFIYEYTNNLTLEEGQVVMHTCDNPCCVNPKHLTIGTVFDNTHDMIKKGRKIVSRGSNNGMAILTADQVVSIKRDTRFHKVIAADYGVSQSTISMIKRGVNWSYI